MLMSLDTERAHIAELCRRHRVVRLTAFGSALTEDFDPLRSDVDLIVEFDPEMGLGRFDAFFALKDGLEALFGRTVDLIDPSALENPYFAATVAEVNIDLYAT